MENNPYQSPVSSSYSEAFNAVAPPLTIKQILFSLTGRIPRRTYWMWYVIIIVATMIVAGLITPLMVNGPEGGEADLNPLGALLFCITVIPAVWIGLAIQVKRWHDLGKSGLWVLIVFIPLVGPIIVLVMCGCMRGTQGSNTYGADPT